MSEGVDVAPDAPAYRHCYVHVPFCARRCSYCDFAISVQRNVPVDDYVRGVQRELNNRKFGAHSLQLDSLYFGGGTPSRLGPFGVRDLMQVVTTVAPLNDGAEVTLEANPEDITDKAVAAWRAAGINRLSIGIQSFDDNVLNWMHRVHNAGTAKRAVQIARDTGINNFSIDLIFALPTALQRNWQSDLDCALALNPDHLSLYGLTVESRTPLGRWTAAGQCVEAPEDLYAAQFTQAHDVLTAAGYEHYEVSNFAKPGMQAVHNSAYWRGVPYLGVGPSAHGFDGAVRRWNVSPFADWLRRVTTSADPIAGYETLTDTERVTEAVYLGLRTRNGLEVAPDDEALVNRWLASGWLEFSHPDYRNHVRCTPSGWLRLDGLASSLTALRSH